MVDVRLALSASLRARRTKHRITQAALAKRLRSSRSRVAKMEAGDPTVSLELLIRAPLTVGASRLDVASALAKRIA